MKTVSGWAFPDADEFMVSELGPTGEYQASHLRASLAHVTDFTIAIDGGAHVGTWSRLLSQSFAHVLAFEPASDTYEALVVNMLTFGCDNVEPRQCALGSKGGFVSMAPLDARAAAMKNTGARFIMSGGKIPRITIDSLELPSLGFLKLDVEGSEPAALEGARATLQRCKPLVLFENKQFWVRRYGQAGDAPQQILASVGYEQREVIGRDEIWAAS